MLHGCVHSIPIVCWSLIYRNVIIDCSSAVSTTSRRRRKYAIIATCFWGLFDFRKLFVMFFCRKILVFQMLLVQDDIRLLVQRESIEVFMSREFWLCNQVRRPPAYPHSTPVLEGSVTGIQRLPNGQFGAKTTADGGQQDQSELATNVSLQTGTSSVQNVSGERFAGEWQGM